MHADGYAGFEELYRSGKIREVACMAHIRRKFFDLHASQGSAIASEALERIAQLYAIEQEARGQPAREAETSFGRTPRRTTRRTPAAALARKIHEKVTVVPCSAL